MPAPYNVSEFPIDRPATYCIRVQGVINPSRFDWFEGLTIFTTPAEQHPAITTLSGPLVDQAALLGVLNCLYDLRLPILSVECCDDQPAQEAT